MVYDAKIHLRFGNDNGNQTVEFWLGNICIADAQFVHNDRVYCRGAFYINEWFSERHQAASHLCEYVGIPEDIGTEALMLLESRVESECETL